MVGKWCSIAPRLTPARSDTAVVDVPLEAVLDEAVDGGLEQPGAHGPGALLLRHADGCGGHAVILTAIKQTVKPAFFVDPQPSPASPPLFFRRLL